MLGVRPEDILFYPNAHSILLKMPGGLSRAIPLDKGVNCADGAAEYRGSAEEGGGDNAYRRGDVGVRVYRNGPGP